MDINDILVSDEALAVIDQGTWVDMSDEAPGLEFLVRGVRSEVGQKTLKDKQTILRKKNRNKELTDEQNEIAYKETLVEALLLDWRGLKNGDQPLPYDQSLARKWVFSRNGGDFTKLVIEAVNRVDAQAREFVEEVSKN